MTLVQRGVPVLPEPGFELCGVLVPIFVPFLRKDRLFPVGLLCLLKFKLNRFAEEKYLQRSCLAAC